MVAEPCRFLATTLREVITREKKGELRLKSIWTKIALSAASISLLFSGVSNAATVKHAAAPHVVLKVLYMNQAGYSISVLQKMGKQFEKLNPNVKIVFTFLPYGQMHSAILTSAAAPQAQYDVVLSDLIWTGEFAQKGYTIPLNGYINKFVKNKNGIPQSVWNGFNIKGKIMAMPFLANFQNFYYNKKMLKEAGFSSGPKTMAQWLTQMKALKAKHIVQYPYEDSWLQAEGLVCDYVRTAGEFGNGNLFNSKGQPIMNQGPALKALQWMRMLYQDGLVNPNSLTADEPTAANAFASGQAAFNTNWTFVTGIMNNPSQSKIVGQGVVSTFPVIPGTNKGTLSSSIAGFQGLAIPANTPSNLRGWAWKWIQFATSPAVQAEHLHSQWPVWSAVANSKAEKKLNPTYQVYQKNLNAVYYRPMVANYLTVSSIIQQYVHEAIAGTIPVKTAANDMVQQIKSLTN